MLDILFEDDYIIAVNKPNNILVHHSAMANNQLEELSLVQVLESQTKKKQYPIHRLDRKTSGVLVFSKSKNTVSKFQELFQSDKIQKKYIAIVRGYTPGSGIIDSPVKGRDALIYKEAYTSYKNIKTIELDIPVHPYDKSRYSLIELLPKTGRLHQLRIHTNKISHPIIGDPKYGDRFHNRMFEEQYSISTMLLHAKELCFLHPFTDNKIIITAPLFPDFIKAFTLFK